MKALEVLKRYGYTGKNDKVYLQCFDFNELKRIKTELMPKAGMDLKLVQLIAYTDWQETFEQNAAGQWVNYSYDWMFRPEGMKEIAKYADGIGPQYPMLIDKASTQGKIKLTGMGHAAHANGLVIHPTPCARTRCRPTPRIWTNYWTRYTTAPRWTVPSATSGPGGQLPAPPETAPLSTRSKPATAGCQHRSRAGPKPAWLCMPITRVHRNKPQVSAGPAENMAILR